MSQEGEGEEGGNEVHLGLPCGRQKGLYFPTFYYTHTTARCPLSTYIYTSASSYMKIPPDDFVAWYNPMPKCWVFGCNISTFDFFPIYLFYGASEYIFPLGGIYC